jgi:phosphoribosyl 1,2-cyclic phosphate phosphodiesterase
VAYLTDVKRLPEEALPLLAGVEVLVLNALFERPHATHLSVSEAVALAGRIGATRTLLTHIVHRHRHADLAARLPAGVEPAYDGLVVPF